MRTLPFAILIAAASLAACATTRMGEPEKLALYSSHAGAPLKTVRYSTPVGWDKVDDTHLLLTMRPREVYLLKISGPCLDWGAEQPTIHISSQAGIVSAKFDRITTPGVPVSCRIDEIRPVDIVAVRAAQDAMATTAP